MKFLTFLAIMMIVFASVVDSRIRSKRSKTKLIAEFKNFSWGFIAAFLGGNDPTSKDSGKLFLDACAQKIPAASSSEIAFIPQAGKEPELVKKPADEKNSPAGNLVTTLTSLLGVMVDVGCMFKDDVYEWIEKNVTGSSKKRRIFLRNLHKNKRLFDWIEEKLKKAWNETTTAVKRVAKSVEDAFDKVKKFIENIVDKVNKFMEKQKQKFIDWLMNNAWIRNTLGNEFLQCVISSQGAFAAINISEVYGKITDIFTLLGQLLNPATVWKALATIGVNLICAHETVIKAWNELKAAWNSTVSVERWNHLGKFTGFMFSALHGMPKRKDAKDAVQHVANSRRRRHL